MSEAIYCIWRRLWVFPLLLCVLGLGFARFMADAGRFVSSPEDAPAHADLIVALGGDTHRRLAKANELFRAGYASRIFLAGPLDERAGLLEVLGIPADSIVVDGASQNSWEEAVNTFALMQRHGWKRVLVVSDPPHLRRLSWAWGRVFAGSGLSFRLIAAPMPDWDPALWRRVPLYKAYVELELEKLLFYLFRYGGQYPRLDLAVGR